MRRRNAPTNRPAIEPPMTIARRSSDFAAIFTHPRISLRRLLSVWILCVKTTELVQCTWKGRRMSALGQKRTLKRLHPMSALPPKADIVQHDDNVRVVPI